MTTDRALILLAVWVAMFFIAALVARHCNNKKRQREQGLSVSE